jgi:D-sedoheptulose 7-phosphate isomerase
MKSILDDHIKVIRELYAQEEEILKCIELMVSTLQSGGKIMLCGNGGSAADAQHIAAELSGRFYKQRDPIDAEALHVNSSYISAVANDMGFDKVYSRALKAKGKKGDLLIALSTSGNSENVVQAVNMAKELSIQTIAMTGKSGGRLKDSADILLAIPSEDTPRIQEAHMLIGHILCKEVEEKLFA